MILAFALWLPGKEQHDFLSETVLVLRTRVRRLTSVAVAENHVQPLAISHEWFIVAPDGGIDVGMIDVEEKQAVITQHIRDLSKCYT